MSEERNYLPTIFDTGAKEREVAIRNLLRGKTPVAEVKKRPMRGGGEANYVNTYYMTRQLSLITGFRWTSEYLEDKARPNWDSPIEIGVKVRVTIWDTKGQPYSHTCWGGKEAARYSKDDPRGTYKKGDIISLFDDIKAAESDAIKKCISYFGVANDIYGGKELEYFATEEGEEGKQSESSLEMSGNEAYRAFGKFLTAKHISVSKVLEILKVDKLSDIEDLKAAHDILVKELSL